ncbi:MAG: hypothetical protein ACOZCO_11435 [Bacteroidota bacterium]
MHNYLKDYQDYYRVRMERYENDPDFKFSYESEKAIYDAIMSCNELVNFRDALGNKNELNAVALTKDQYTLRLKHYREIKEDVRALGPERIMSKADQFTNVMDLMEMVNEEELINIREISVDHVYFFRDSIIVTDTIEVYETANIPDKYKRANQKYAEERKKDLRERLADIEKEMDQWKPGYHFDFNLVWEERHRRLIPFPDEVILEKINELKKIVNR